MLDPVRQADIVHAQGVSPPFFSPYLQVGLFRFVIVAV